MLCNGMPNITREQQKKFLENLKDIGPKPMEIGGAKEVQSN